MDKSVQTTIVVGTVLLIALLMLLTFEPNAKITLNILQGIIEYESISAKEISEIKTKTKPEFVDVDKIIGNTLFSNTHNFEISIPNTEIWAIENRKDKLRQISDETGLPVVAQIKSLDSKRGEYSWQINVVADEVKNMSVSSTIDHFIDKFNTADYSVERDGVVLKPRLGEPERIINENAGTAKMSAPIELCINDEQICVPKSTLVTTMHKERDNIIAVIGFAEPQIENTKPPTLNEDIRYILESVARYQ